jgi:cysteine synthase
MHGAVRRAEELAAEHPTGSCRSSSQRRESGGAPPTTAREILAQLPEITAFVAGVGTGGRSPA